MNGITAEQALGACQMTGSVPLSTLYSGIKATRKKGTYDDHVQKDARRLSAIININEDEVMTGVVSPVTIDASL